MWHCLWLKANTFEVDPGQVRKQVTWLVGFCFFWKGVDGDNF